MSFSFKLISHTKDGELFSNGQLLVDHLRGVTDIALKTNSMHGINGDIKDVIKIICMCHDFGKASSYFQDYLKGEYGGELKNHGEISAYFAYYMLPEKWKLIGFMCVKRHHGDLEPDVNFFEFDRDKLIKISGSIEKNIDEINEIYGFDVSDFFTYIKDEKFLRKPRGEFRKKFNKFTIDELLTLQYIWSLLLTADKSQLIRSNAYENETEIYEEYVKNYKEMVRQEMVKKVPGIDKTALFKIRNDIYNGISQSLDEVDINKNHIFSINVPTGTGKTISVYGGAFKLLQRIYTESSGNIMPTIIYCIPFTSVIDQNYQVLEDIFDKNKVKKYESLILKHHSMTPIEYNSKEGQEEKEYRNYDARFCVENWQSTIITTTFVQLFNTIFKTGVNSIGNRFHKLAGSIIVLDEVQAIPPKYYKVIEEVFKILCEKFNTYVITVTATKPILLQGVELVKNNKEIFDSLDRIIIENFIDITITLDEFADIVFKDIAKNEDKSFLIVLNTVKSSLKIYDFLSDSNRKVIYLSTEIHPARRLEIINEIKNNKDCKYVLVSTQLIEAGVDLDFDVVYRDFSTIDSLNQTAGRANRNAISRKGIVKIYSIINEEDKDKNKKFSRYIYPIPLLEATEKILKNRKIIKESEIYNINQEYFMEVDKLKSDDRSEDIMKAISEMNFVEIKKLFQLIEEDYAKEDIIINYNEETERDLRIIEEGSMEYQDILNAWRRLNKYKVAVAKKDMKDINCYIIKGANIVNREDYDETRGIKRRKTTFC